MKKSFITSLQATQKGKDRAKSCFVAFSNTTQQNKPRNAKHAHLCPTRQLLNTMQTSTGKNTSQKAKIGPEAQWIKNFNPIKLTAEPCQSRWWPRLGNGQHVSRSETTQFLSPDAANEAMLHTTHWKGEASCPTRPLDVVVNRAG